MILVGRTKIVYLLLNKSDCEQLVMQLYLTFSLEVSHLDRTRGNGLKLCEGRFIDWILGEITLLKQWSGIGTGCPGRWLSHRPWRCSKNV